MFKPHLFLLLLSLSAVPGRCQTDPSPSDDHPLVTRLRSHIAESGIEGLSSEEVDLVMGTNFQAEVNNGGLHQFFFNSDGDFFSETVQSLQNLDSSEVSATLSEAGALFPPPGPARDWTVRQQQLHDFPTESILKLENLTRFILEPRQQSGLEVSLMELESRLSWPTP